MDDGLATQARCLCVVRRPHSRLSQQQFGVLQTPTQTSTPTRIRKSESLEFCLDQAMAAMATGDRDWQEKRGLNIDKLGAWAPMFCLSVSLYGAI